MFSRKELLIIDEYLPMVEIDLKAKVQKILQKPLSPEELFEIAKTMTKEEFLAAYTISELEKNLFLMIYKAGQCEIEPVIEHLHYEMGYSRKDILAARNRLKKTNIIWPVNDMPDWYGTDEYAFKK